MAHGGIIGASGSRLQLLPLLRHFGRISCANGPVFPEIALRMPVMGVFLCEFAFLFRGLGDGVKGWPIPAKPGVFLLSSHRLAVRVPVHDD
jgi:hypothetical protein